MENSGILETQLEQSKNKLHKAPFDAEAHNECGVCLLKTKRFSEALECFDKAVTYQPKYSEAHFNKGRTLLRLNSAIR